MNTSQNIGAYQEDRMNPKDERLVLLSYNVGRNEHLETENYSLRKRVEELENALEKANNIAESESRREQSIMNNYYALERKYDNLKKKTTKKKVVKK